MRSETTLKYIKETEDHINLIRDEGWKNLSPETQEEIIKRILWGLQYALYHIEI